MTDKLTATLDKAGVRAISTDLWGIFFEDISYSGDGGLNADLVQNGAFEYNRADSIDWSNYSFWRKIVPEGSFAAFCIHDNDPVATENPHYATVEVEHAPAALDNTGWDGMVFRAGETYDFTAWMRVRSESAMPVTVSLRGDDGSIIEPLFSFGIAMGAVSRKAGRRHANRICIVTYTSANPIIRNGGNISVSLCICNDFTESREYNIVTYQS